MASNMSCINSTSCVTVEHPLRKPCWHGDKMQWCSHMQLCVLILYALEASILYMKGRWTYIWNIGLNSRFAHRDDFGCLQLSRNRTRGNDLLNIMRKYLDDYSAYLFKKVLDIVWSRPLFCSSLATGLALPVCTERAFTGSRMHGSVEGSFNRL